MSAFQEALEAAETGADVLAALWKALDGTGDPPSPEAMAEWWPECPDAAREKATSGLREMARTCEPEAPGGLIEGCGLWTWTGWDNDETAHLYAHWPVAIRTAWTKTPTGARRLALDEDGPPGVEWTRGALEIAALSRRWIEADPRPAFPLAPILQAWITWSEDRPKPTAPYVITKRASLPALDRDGAQLIDYTPPAFGPEPDQLELPGFEAVRNGLPHWLLHLYDAAGGPISQGGRLPLDLQLQIGAMVRLGIGQRDGGWRTLRFPHRIEHEDGFDGVAAVERWLWPHGWGKNRYSRWHLILEALEALTRNMRGWFYLPGVGNVAMLTPSVIPKRRDDPLIEFTLRIPGAAAHGARFDWPRFARYGVKSATLARAHLSALAAMHRTARDGHPITRRIAAPILNAGGHPVRRKGGAIVRSDTERETNPSTRFLTWVTDSDLARMIGYPERGASQTATDRKPRELARKAFKKLAVDGVIELEEHRGRFRIFGPEGW